MRTRAIDNHISIVSAVNQGRSCIVNGGGEILAINKRDFQIPAEMYLQAGSDFWRFSLGKALIASKLA